MRMRSYRIMEALSAVDEELLARCEQTHENGRRVHGFARGMSAASRPIWRYVGVWAAVLCLAVAGGASWGGYQLMRRAGSDSSSSGGADMNGQMYQEIYDAEKAEEDNTPEAAGAYLEEQQELRDDTGYTDGMDGVVSAESDIEDGCDQVVGNYGDIENKDMVQENMENQLCKQSEVRIFTLEEAQELDDLGCYVPRRLPEGYAFEGATYYPDAVSSLTVILSRGTDSIMLNIEEKKDSVSTADVRVTEAYDKRLYEIPYGETVPAKYGETFQSPVFAYGDFDLEIVKSRMVSCEGAGDGDMPSGCFGVLYPDGVLVSFDGHGTAEEIWEMFCSMGEGIQ